MDSQGRGGGGGRARGRGRGGGRGRGAKPGSTSNQRKGMGGQFEIQFLEYSTILDELHDRRERIIKVSRDITIASKRIIFLLHRAYGDEREAVLTEAREKQTEIISLFDQISNDLQSQNMYRHLKSISPGIEEFIEAASFFYYIETGEICTVDYIQGLLTNENGEKILNITPQDFVLGLADLTGEMMRYCINSVVRGDHVLATEIADMLRRVRNDYELLNFPPSFKKMPAMRSSCQKAEQACYSIQVRGSEFPDAGFIVQEYPIQPQEERYVGQSQNMDDDYY